MEIVTILFNLGVVVLTTTTTMHGDDDGDDHDDEARKADAASEDYENHDPLAVPFLE